MAGSPDGFKRMRSILSKISGEGLNGKTKMAASPDDSSGCVSILVYVLIPRSAAGS